MDDDATQKTLDVLGDLYLTGTASREPAKPQSARSVAGQLDGPPPLRFPKAAIADRAFGQRGQSPRIAPTSRPRGQSRVEAVFLGNLPGFGGPWLTQYAHHLANEHGPVGVLHVDHEQIDLELVGTVNHRDDLNDLAKAGNVPVSQGLVAALSSLTRPRLPVIGAWLIHLPMPLNETALTIAPDLPRWTMVCSNDQASIVSAYRWAKQLLRDEEEGEAPHRLGLMVMGCDDETARETARKLTETVGSFLDAGVELVGSRRQMVPVELRSLGSFEAGPGLWPRVADFLESQAAPMEDVIESSSTMHEPEAPAEEAAIETDEEEKEALRATLRAIIVPEEKDDDSEDTIDMDAAEVLEADLADMGEEPQEPEETAEEILASYIEEAPEEEMAEEETPDEPVIPQTAMNDSVQRFIARLKQEQPKPVVDIVAASPSPVPVPRAEPVQQVAAAPAPKAKPAPELVEPEPQPIVQEQPRPQPKPQPQPIAAAPAVAPVGHVALDQFIAGDQRGPVMQARCPHHPQVQLMLDPDGGLHLMLRNDSAVRPFTIAMRELEQTRDWARDHSALLQLTMPGVTFDAHRRPIIHLFTDDARAAAAHVSQVAADVRLHLLHQVHVGSASTWFSTPIN